MANASPVQFGTPGAMAAVVLGSALLAGCENASTGVPTVQLQVTSDKSEYSLASDSGAAPLLVNLGPAVVYAPMNEYVYVERLGAAGWQDRRPWFVVDGVGISFPIHAGDTLRAWPMSFRYVGRQPGVYRFLFEVAFDSLGRRLVPEELRASPPFELRP